MMAVPFLILKAKVSFSGVLLLAEKSPKRSAEKNI
jgi:hypothetical protein